MFKSYQDKELVICVTILWSPSVVSYTLSVYLIIIVYIILYSSKERVYLLWSHCPWYATEPQVKKQFLWQCLKNSES